jgi:hypothetical protein
VEPGGEALRLDQLLGQAADAAERLAAGNAEQEARAQYAARIEREAQAEHEPTLQAQDQAEAELWILLLLAHIAEHEVARSRSS